jgi:hypothetical protein
VSTKKWDEVRPGAWVQLQEGGATAQVVTLRFGLAAGAPVATVSLAGREGELPVSPGDEVEVTVPPPTWTMMWDRVSQRWVLDIETSDGDAQLDVFIDGDLWAADEARRAGFETQGGEAAEPVTPFPAT